MERCIYWLFDDSRLCVRLLRMARSASSVVANDGLRTTHLAFPVQSQRVSSSPAS